MRKRWRFELLLVVALIAVLGSFVSRGLLDRRTVDGVYYYFGGFVYEELRLKDGHYEIRSSGCTYENELVSEGSYSLDLRGRLVLRGSRGRTVLELEPIEDGFIDHSDGDMERQFIQHIRADGSRVESPREVSPLG